MNILLSIHILKLKNQYNNNVICINANSNLNNNSKQQLNFIAFSYFRAFQAALETSRASPRHLPQFNRFISNNYVSSTQLTSLSQLRK